VLAATQTNTVEMQSTVDNVQQEGPLYNVGDMQLEDLDEEDVKDQDDFVAFKQKDRLVHKEVIKKFKQQMEAIQERRAGKTTPSVTGTDGHTKTEQP